MRLTTLITGVIMALSLGLASCDRQTDTEKKAAPTVATSQNQVTPRTPAPQAVSLSAIDACKDEVVSANRVSERQAYTLPTGTRYKTRDGLDVVVNVQGIWGGCKAALEAKARAPALRSTETVTLTRTNYTELYNLAYVYNPTTRKWDSRKDQHQVLASENATIKDVNKTLVGLLIFFVILSVVFGLIVVLGVMGILRPMKAKSHPKPRAAPMPQGRDPVD